MESYLRGLINSGELKPGDMIPTESQLGLQFGVSRMTVRQALGRLVYDGLIVRYRGQGSFVAEPRFEHSHMWLSFEEEMRARGARPSIKLLNMQRSRAEGKVAQSLNVAVDTVVLVLERLRLVNDQAVGFEARYLPMWIGERLTPDDIHNQPLTAAVRRILGKARTRLDVRVSASVAQPNDVKTLETKIGSPVLIRENTWFTEPEGPVQYSKTIFRGDRYEMFLQFTPTFDERGLSHSDQVLQPRAS
jgi:GntR family transcriptional regulator